ncbi:hypothetical protein Tco_0548710 [Tanacetum coccineum]
MTKSFHRANYIVSSGFVQGFPRLDPTCQTHLINTLHDISSRNSLSMLLSFLINSMNSLLVLLIFFKLLSQLSMIIGLLESRLLSLRPEQLKSPFVAPLGDIEFPGTSTINILEKRLALLVLLHLGNRKVRVSAPLDHLLEPQCIPSTY